MDKDEIKEGLDLAKNIETGNVLGAAKNVINMAKNKKTMKKRVIGAIMQILPFLLTTIIVLTIFFSVGEMIKELLTKIGTVTTGFFRWLNDDYWVDLDEKIDFSTDTNNNGDENTSQDIDAEEKEEPMTIVDKYITDLGKSNISLKDLRILGDADYSDIDKLLEEGENKRLVSKYISEFIRADIITQDFHKRRGTELVNPYNENQIDGGIYLYRSTKDVSIKEDEFLNGNSYEAENIEVTEKSYKQMTYVDKDKFIEKVNSGNKDAMYEFSLDKESGELLVAKITTIKEIEGDVSNTLNSWTAGLYQWLADNNMAGKTEYQMEIVKLSYKEYIAKYVMPYEFLLNLCMITENPEFAYHVALLARETKIVLAIQDHTTIERETIEIQEKEETYKNSSDNKRSGAEVTERKDKKTRKVKTTTTLDPNLLVEYADTWSFYEEFEYTKNISGTLEENIKPEDPEIQEILRYQQEPTIIKDETYTGAIIDIEIPGYWYDTFVTERTIFTQVINTEVTYNSPIMKGDPVEKSKQFLGLLRNDTGKCKYDCFNDWSKAKDCAKEAVFKKDGINVSYRIPNMDRTETAYNRLTSGIDILYQALDGNLGTSNNTNKTEDENYDPNKDIDSIYSQKMQGLSEHMRYLMGLPPNESYTIKDLILDTLEDILNPDDEGNYDEGTIASAREIYEFLIGKGMTPESACAILGNIQQESSFNTGATNGTHYGLCQWGDGRWEGLKEFAEQRGTSWTDLYTQLEYMWSELCGSKSNVKDAIMNSTDMQYSTDVFCRQYEICGNYSVEVPRRYKYAKYWYDLFVNGVSTDSNILAIAKQYHDFLRENNYYYSSDANKKRGGPPFGWQRGSKDGTSTGRNIPIPTSPIEDTSGRYIDCSSYVSWVLYEAGYRKDAGWQWSSSELLNNPMHFEEVSVSNMRQGDILVKDGHAEIYAGNGRSYSCGRTRSIRADTVQTMSGIQKVFRAP